MSIALLSENRQGKYDKRTNIDKCVEIKAAAGDELALIAPLTADEILSSAAPLVEMLQLDSDRIVEA